MILASGPNSEAFEKLYALILDHLSRGATDSRGRLRWPAGISVSIPRGESELSFSIALRIDDTVNQYCAGNAEGVKLPDLESVHMYEMTPTGGYPAFVKVDRHLRRSGGRG